MHRLTEFFLFIICIVAGLFVGIVLMSIAVSGNQGWLILPAIIAGFGTWIGGYYWGLSKRCPDCDAGDLKGFGYGGKGPKCGTCGGTGKKQPDVAQPYQRSTRFRP
jgi:hypothetical protein